MDIFSKDLILVPILKSDHWSLLVLNTRKMTLKYYNSLASTNPSYRSAFISYLRKEAEKVK